MPNLKSTSFAAATALAAFAAFSSSGEAGTSVTGPKEIAQRSTDFDFVAGPMIVHHRRLVGRLQGSTEWEEFVTFQNGGLLLGGLANFDEQFSAETGEWIGMSFRTFDLTTKQWQIYWVAARDGVLQPPVSGQFDEQGEAVFGGEDVLDGKKIDVRYFWTGTRTATPRWSQAFSGDGGKTWETNWIMDFSRPPAP